MYDKDIILYLLLEHEYEIRCLLTSIKTIFSMFSTKKTCKI